MPVLQTINKGYSAQLRDMPQNEAVAHLEVTLTEVAQEYGARYEITENLLVECIRLVLRQFPYLGLEEIRQAFRLVHSQEIKIKGAEAYGGEFSASMLGKTLGAYSEYRRKAVAYLINEREEIKKEARRREIVAQRKKNFEATFWDKVKDFAQEKGEDGTYKNGWEDVPFWWYQVLIDRGRLQVDKEKALAVWEDAKEFNRHISEDAAQDDPRVKLEDFAPSPERVKTIARKVYVFREVILKLRNE